MGIAERSQTFCPAGKGRNSVRKNENALVLFARDPVPGQVKTRLHPFLDAETICDLYLCFLDDSIETLQRVENADRFIGVYPGHLSGYFPGLQADASVYLQEGKDLGERMRSTFRQRFEEGYGKVVIIGADSPSLPAAYIREAFSSGKDIVLGPSTDGGYYLIGMAEKLLDVFDGVSWGTDQVLRQTLNRIRQQGATLALLPVWYDVDCPEDLRFLKIHSDLMAESGLPEGPATGRFLRELDL